MKIYSTRHGQTDYNKNDLILGTTDMELNETGLAQAAELAEKIRSSEDIKIDIIISSPMKRARKTAEIVAAANGLEIVIDERLREWDYGRYEGMHRTAEGFHENKLEFGVKMGETGESLLELAHRVYSAIDDIKGSYSGMNVLLVSHGGICRVIETYFNRMTAEQFSNWFMGNCQLLEYNTGE